MRGECGGPGLSVDFRGLATIGVGEGVSLGGEISGSGMCGGCTDCSWSVDAKISVGLTGKAVLITKIDPSVLNFQGGVKGDGSLSGSCNCEGCGNLKGCLGPVSVFGTVTLANFISKGGEIVIPHTQVCTQ